MRLRYLGPSPRTIYLPVPLLARSELAGQVVFNPDGDIDDENGARLLALDPRFERVTENGGAQPPAARAYKRTGFATRGLAVAQQRKFFPTGSVRQGADGWEITDDAPSPPPAEGAAAIPAPAGGQEA